MLVNMLLLSIGPLAIAVTSPYTLTLTQPCLASAIFIQIKSGEMLTMWETMLETMLVDSFCVLALLCAACGQR